METILQQTIHVFDGKPRFLEEHLRELQRGWFTLLGENLQLDSQKVHGQIEELLIKERCPRGYSSYVRLAIDFRGGVHYSIEGESLYRGYVLRALRPDAVAIRFEVPFAGVATVAAHQTWQTALRIAEQRKVRSVVRMSEDTTLLEADGAPLFAVAARTIYSSRELHSVEGRLAMEAIRRAGYSLRIMALKRSHLPDIEELFYVDHRGVTALRSCDGKLMLSAVAERVAEQLEAIVRKK